MNNNSENISFHPAALVELSMQDVDDYYRNSLFEWMCLLSDSDTIFENMLPIFRRYKVGVTPNNEVIYWQHDLQGNCRGGKLMRYNADGHRDKSYGARWVHSDLKVPDFNLSQVPFGLHLLPTMPPDNTVAVVESEKTALMAAAYHVVHFNNDTRLPLFIATGGAGNLAAALSHLKGRRVVIFPDEDQIIEWSNIASRHASSFRSIAIDTTVRQCVLAGLLPPKSDYGDLLALKYTSRCKGS